MKVIISIIVLALIAIGVWAIVKNPETPADEETMENAEENAMIEEDNSAQTGSSDSDGQMVEEDAMMEEKAATIEVHYTASGFNPKIINIRAGDTIKWVNDTQNPMWVASAQHPTHVVYSGTSLKDHCPDVSNNSLDQCENGDTWSFTFNKTGSWVYHNHSRSNDTGTITVEQ